MSNRVFGQATRRRGGGTNYQRQIGNTHSRTNHGLTEEQELAMKRKESRQKRKIENEALDERFGCAKFTGDGVVKTRRGWIYNILPTTISTTDDNSASDTIMSGPERAGLDLYFLSTDGSTFKSTVLCDPYFYVIASPPSSHTRQFSRHSQDSSVFYETVISTLLRQYEGIGLKSVEKVKKLDLDALNHLSPSNKDGRTMLKLSFDTVQQLIDVRKEILPLVKKNKLREKESLHHFGSSINERQDLSNPLSSLIDIREYDVPYSDRVCIDMGIRAGTWYTVTTHTNDCGVTLSEQDVATKANPTFLAFDIECTKAPLKFPDANVDSIFMISYMVNGVGYLIVSRDVVGCDIKDFEYNPKPSYPGPFKIFNEMTEEDLIRRFLSEYQRLKPQIVVTYNGDFFDWPFLDQRAAHYGLDLRYELGVEKVNTPGGEGSTKDGEYRGRCCVHLDAFNWVQRDSYLPQGAQGLKAVTKYKLGYDPVEVEPEDMMRYARERPVEMAQYSVSDAVATYYLYEKYVHLFIFSLCTIIPMGPEDVLRKGSGTLCEALLMVQSCTKDIICPNKHTEDLAKFHNGHLLESETYIGGKVECLETGVFRSDIEYDFDLNPPGFQGLIDNVDRDLTFAIEVEMGKNKKSVTNYDDVRKQIIERLENLRDNPKRTEKPLVYHIDVGAMYPNIILTNRLQPNAIVDDSVCAACEFNQSKNNCKRKMDWVWRGDYNPASKKEYEHVKDQLTRETFDDGKSFYDLTDKEQAAQISQRLKKYSRNAYKKGAKVTEEITKTDTVCMRENDFYVSTVRGFRDRRYEYKSLTKKWKKNASSAADAVSKKDAEDRALVYDSLQVAHKCILNSFYGYVMRKGARWRSMEMAGIVTKTGADLIVQARILVEQIGRPLELDTDGIWCILPHSFPDIYSLEMDDGSKERLEYPCIMLNADVNNNFTNHQYQTVDDPEKGTYKTRSECSIFFELDGPYKCMVLPSSTEEGRLLKKRYAVFDFDGKLTELKGFELKRRGELELIKTFQSEVFERFLDGDSLNECYESVAEVANHWIDILDTQGESLETDELVDLISENKSMSKTLEEYGNQKGTSQTTARRLSEFLGKEMVKDKGLNCRFVIAELPHGAPVTERAIPTAIWKAEPSIMKHFLRKWLKSPGLDEESFDIRNVLDWEYYKDRLGKTIQKIITIPAAMQKVPNPVPRVEHPEWLQKTVRKLNDKHKQQDISKMFAKMIDKETIEPGTTSPVPDMEDIGGKTRQSGRPIVHRKIGRRVTPHKESKDDESENETIQRDCNQPIDSKETTVSPEISDNRIVSLSDGNFQDWLSNRKSKWNFSERRKRRQLESNTASKVDENIENERKKQRKIAGSMQGYIRDNTMALLEQEWHVVEIREILATENGSNTISSGNFIVWIMLRNGSLQKIQVSVPRVLYLNCKEDLKGIASSSISIKEVQRHLPHNKEATKLFEVTLSEQSYQQDPWLEEICDSKGVEVVESFFEVKTPLLLRSLLHMGSVCRTQGAASPRGRFDLSDLKRIEHPEDGEYLNKDLSYKRIFMYERAYTKSKNGIMAVFFVDGNTSEGDCDVTQPQMSRNGSLKLTSSCHIWILQSGRANVQKNFSRKSGEAMFNQLLEQLTEAAGEQEESEYSCLSPDSKCVIKNVTFADSEKQAFDGVHEILNSYNQANNGPTFLVLNHSRPNLQQLRKLVPSCNSFPLIPLPPPPGIAHSSSSVILPALNWEPLVVQTCFESFLHMGAVSFPRGVALSRFGNIPLGNLGTDGSLTSFDISFARMLQKNRVLLWASEQPGQPDLGYESLPTASNSGFMGITTKNTTGNTILDSNDIWGDEDEKLNPVVSYPGAYRTVCVEIDVNNLCVAALTDPKSMLTGAANMLGKQNDIMSSMNDSYGIPSISAPLGDEMSTAVSLPLLRMLAQTWLRDASVYSSNVADQLLGNFYHLVSSHGAVLNDPALHRVLLSLMKKTFQELLSEFQLLGSTIIFANFNRIVIATSKTTLIEAKEYIDFIIQTIGKRLSLKGNDIDGLSRLSLKANSFYSNYIFLDQNNFGGILYESQEVDDSQEVPEFSFNLNQGDQTICILPSVIGGWNIMHYLANELSQEYFRVIVGRFSKDVYHKQVSIEQKEVFNSASNEVDESHDTTKDEQLVAYKKKLISHDFASYMTRAVADICRDDSGDDEFPSLPGSHLRLTTPALEFIKSVLVVLELDPDIDNEVRMMKKSLLTQIGIQEYSTQAKWNNPCFSFLLPDVYCPHCHSIRDVDLSALPTNDEGQGYSWTCEDCNSPYDSAVIEGRLIEVVERKCLRYQLQDLRCSKSTQISTRVMSSRSELAAEMLLDRPREDLVKELRVMHNIAGFYNLELLQEILQMLGSGIH